MYKKFFSAHSIGERMVFKSWTILTTTITTKTNLTMQTIWTTATMQTTQVTTQIPVTAQTTQAAILETTLGKTQALTTAPTHLKTADSSVEPLPESTRPRKDGPGGD